MSDLENVWANSLPSLDAPETEYSLIGVERGSNQGVIFDYDKLADAILTKINDKKFAYSNAYSDTLVNAVASLKTSVTDINDNMQTKLTFDDKPIEDSSNPVTSDGIYEAFQDFISTIYPIGSIYITVDNTFDPNEKLIGSWSKIQDAFLRGSVEDEEDNVGSVGGQDTIYLSASQLPAHYHSVGVATTKATGEASSTEFGLTTSGTSFTNRVIVSSSSVSVNSNCGFYYDTDGTTKKYIGTDQVGVNLVPSHVICNFWHRYA